MTDIVNGKGPRDVLVALIIKALDTGIKRRDNWSARDEGFYIGRVSAFVYGAAQIADQMYGVPFSRARHSLMKAVRQVRTEWPVDDLTDAGKVGNKATEMATALLLEDL
jgi:hypothetical protein